MSSDAHYFVDLEIFTSQLESEITVLEADVAQMNLTVISLESITNAQGSRIYEHEEEIEGQHTKLCQIVS